MLDLGSGSGMDAFVAARQVGESRRIEGIDVTDAQLRKSERLRAEHGFDPNGFAELLGTSPGLARELLAQMSERLRRSVQPERATLGRDPQRDDQ